MKISVGDLVTWQVMSNFSKRANRVLATKEVVVTTGKGVTREYWIGLDNDDPDWRTNPYHWIKEENCTLVQRCTKCGEEVNGNEVMIW